jgi:hypothetical protein
MPDAAMPMLITNKHVIRDALSVTVAITHMTNNGPAFGKFTRIDIDSTGFEVIEHPDPSIDLAAFSVSRALTEMDRLGTPGYYRGLSVENIPTTAQIADLTSIEDILMIGYPTGIWDEANNLPIVRRGTTATPYAVDYNNKPEFAIDCACFPGSSGSPIFIANNGSYPGKNGPIIGSRFFLMGLLWGGPQYDAQGEIVARPVPTSTGSIAISRIPTNLGYCLKARLILDLVSLVTSRFS